MPFSLVDLRAVTLFVVLVALGAVSTLFAARVAGLVEQAIEARLQDEIALVARAISPRVAEHLVHADLDGIEASLEGVFDIGRVYGAAVFDRSGRYLAGAGRADREVSTSRTAADAVAGREPAGSYREIEAEAVYSYFTPLFDEGGRIRGLLQVNRDRAEIDATLRRVRLQAWVLWGTAVLLVGGLILVGHRRLIEAPVRKLHAALRRVPDRSHRNRMVPVDIRFPREFRDLGAAVDDLVRALRGADEEQEHYRHREIALLGELASKERIAAVGHMAASVAHELGSPLTVLRRRIGRALGEEAPEHRDRELARALEECERLKAIVEQLLDYCREGDLSAHGVVDLRVVVRGALASLDRERLLPIAIDLKLPDAPATIRGDRLRLEIAVANLLRNAVRHARSTVLCSVEADPERWVLRVVDDGDGVPEPDRKRIFEPFARRQAGSSGTGLGLAIVARIAAEHGGDARLLQDRPDRGAAFELRLPRHEESVP